MKRLIPISLIGFLGGLFLVYTAVTEMKLTKDLETRGKISTGQIISGKKHDGSYKLNVSYLPWSDEVITKEFEFSATGDTAEKLVVDDVIIAKTVDIVFLPEDGYQSRIDGQFAPGKSALIAGICVTLVGLLFLIVALKA